MQRIALLAGGIIALSLSVAASPAAEVVAIIDGGEGVEHDFGPASHERFAERVGAAREIDYRAILSAYDARAAEAPEDFVSQIERCRFIEVFAYSEDVIIESASDDLDACRDALLASGHAGEVPVILYGIEGEWGEEGLARAQALLPASAAWTAQQQATLYELLADRARYDDARQAGWYATKAVERDPSSRMLLEAARHLVAIGVKDRARRLLVDAPPQTWESLSRASAAELLMDMNDVDAAAVVLGGADAGDVFSRATLARVQAARGDADAARSVYRELLEGERYLSPGIRAEYFEFERRHGTAESATAAYAQLRDTGFGADPMARRRLALLFSHPGADWQWRDAPGLLTLLAAIALCCLLPLLAIAPVHYRGLARQIAGHPPGVTGPHWRLRHGWYAMAAMSVSGFGVAYVLLPGIVEQLGPWLAVEPPAPATNRGLARVLLWSTVLTLVLLLPLLRGRSIRSLLLGKWSILRSVLAALGLAIGLRLVAGLVGALSSGGALGDDTTRAMQGLSEYYGLWAMLLVAALAVPVVEELIFRGVLLEAFRARVTFWFAALAQAVLFVVLHEQWQSMPYLFVFALVATWLARRSQGLLAPIVLHSVNNAFASLTLIGMTTAINEG